MLEGINHIYLKFQVNAHKKVIKLMELKEPKENLNMNMKQLEQTDKDK